MPYPLRVLALCAAVAFVAVPAGADETEVQPGDQIMWAGDLPKAFEQAKEKQKILMICVNAKHVVGRQREEPAAKGLREVVYKDVRVVKESRDFVCAFLTPSGDSSDYGELRALGIEGLIVSPQHIFVHPDGEKILVRLEYWSHGSGETGVKALLDLMSKAKAKATGGDVESPPEVPEEPEDPNASNEPAPGVIAPDVQHAKEREEWIGRMIDLVKTGTTGKRQEAVVSLVTNDQDGDCVDPLVALIPDYKKNIPVLVDIIRALGRDGLQKAALPIAELLDHKEAEVRGNAAVSLEYIGCQDKAVIAALKKRAGHEKDEALANHVYRALGRCGAQDAKVRALLLKKSEGAKSEFASFGPIIGLAYFTGDPKAARAVEKLLKKMGAPGGRRGGGTNTLKRALLAWTLAEIGDEKSGKFMREVMLPPLEHMQSRWVGPLADFYEAVAKKCEGDPEAMDAVVQGVRGTEDFINNWGGGRGGSGQSSERPSLNDEYRKNRDTSTFEPKGDFFNAAGTTGQ